MNHTRIIRIMSIFMMLLIICVPATFALQIKQVLVTGSEGIPDAVRDTDTVSFEVTVGDVDAVDVPLLTTLLTFAGYAQSPFETCVDQGNGDHVCSFSEDISAFGRKEFPYILELYNRVDDKVDSFAGKYVVDDQPPSFGLLTFRQDGSEVVAAFAVSDFFTPGLSNDVCAGIASVDVKKDATVLASSIATGCDFSGELRFSLSALGSGQTHVLCASAIDNFGHSAQECTTFVVDNVDPQLTPAVFSNDDTPEIVFLGNSVQAQLKFRVIEERLDDVQLVVNGQDLNVVCSRQSGSIHNCATSSFLLSPDNYSLSMSAVDVSGNTDTLTQQIEVGLDRTRPLLVTFGTSVLDGEDSIVSEHVSVRALFEEAHSGFFKRQVFLQLPNNIRVQADECVEQGQWECVWVSLDLAGISNGDQRFIVIDSRDDAGNVVEGRSGLDTEFTLVVDTTAPTVEEFSLFSFSQGIKVPFAYSFAPLFMDVLFEDEHDVIGTLDVSAFDRGLVFGDCSENNCSFVTDNMPQGPLVGDVVLNLSDVAGNDGLFSVEVELFQITEGESDNWQHSGELSPSAIDRSTAELINNVIYAEIEFESPSRAQLVDVTLDGCRSFDEEREEEVEQRSGFITGREVEDVFGGSASSDIQFIQDFEQVQIGDATSTTQFIKFTLKATSFADVNRLRLTCDFLIASSRGDQFFPEEIETVDINIPFFSLGPGDLGESFEAEVQAAIDDANEGILNKIAELEEFVEIARTICNVVYGLFGVLFSLNKILILLGVTKDGLLASIVGSPGGASLGAATGPICFSNEGVKAGASGILKIATVFCDFINCRLSLADELIGGLGGDAGQGFIDFKNNLYELGGGGLVNYVQDRPVGGSPAAFNAEESLFWSVANLCIPGIIKNLNEYRQIKCRYAICLRDDVPNGVPKQACDDMKSYMTCKYVYGEIFASIPIIAFFDVVMEQLKAILASPTAIIGAVIAIGCAGTCPGTAIPVIGGWLPWKVCNVFQLFTAFGEVISAITGILSSDTWQIEGEDICEEL